MGQVTVDDPDVTIETILTRWPATAEVFLRHRTHCVGCLIAPFHTVIDTCAEYDLDEEMFRRALREAATTR